MMINDLTYWQAALAGKEPDVIETQPQCGYYRLRLTRAAPWLPVVIWHKAGKLTARVAGTEIAASDETCDTWMRCAKHPVGKEAAMHAFKHGAWPDMPSEAPKSNMPSDPFEALLAEINDKQAQAEALLAKGEAKTKIESNLGRNLQKQLLDLHKRADAMFTEEKAPVIKREREIAEKFRFREPLKSVADRLRTYWEKWAKVEETRLNREADLKAENERKAVAAVRRAVEEQQAKLMRDDPISALTSPSPEMPELPLPPEQIKVRVGGGYGSRGGLRSVWTPTITDYNAALAHFSEHPDVKVVIEKLVKAETRTHKSATKIPGVIVGEDRRAA